MCVFDWVGRNVNVCMVEVGETGCALGVEGEWSDSVYLLCTCRDMDNAPPARSLPRLPPLAPPPGAAPGLLPPLEPHLHCIHGRRALRVEWAVQSSSREEGSTGGREDAGPRLPVSGCGGGG